MSTVDSKKHCPYKIFVIFVADARITLVIPLYLEDKLEQHNLLLLVIKRQYLVRKNISCCFDRMF